MKIEEGYVKCSACNGTGEDGAYICHKCQGEGVTDWITNAMFREKPVSALDSINVKIMLNNLRKNIEENFLETSTVNVRRIEEQLGYLKSSRALCDYKVSAIETPNEKCFNITIKPNRSIEMIQVKFEVTQK